MGNSLRITTLASAVALGLAGLALCTPGNALAGTMPAGSHARAESVQSYFINFAEPGLVSYQGGVTGFAPTAPSATHTRKLDVHSPAAVAWAEHLAAARQGYISAIQSALGHQIPVTHHYAVTHNGIAANLSASEAAAVRHVPGVVLVKPAGLEHLVTYRGPEFIGAGGIWDGTTTPDGVGTLGEGIVAAIVDSGANSAHPSFANDPACGFDSSNPKLVALSCATTDSSGLCNGPNPEADATSSGHGVHVASTVAGNTLDNTASPAPTLPNGVSMSGIAPCAKVISYKVCNEPNGLCATAHSAAAINNAIIDHADVLNFSISGGTSPWSSVDNDRNFLDAVDADIFVAAAAGNMRTGDTTPVGMVNHRGPWVMTVAASTHDQFVGPTAELTGPAPVPPELQGIALYASDTTSSTPTVVDKPVKSFPSNIEGCTASGAFPPNTFDGSIALIRRGTCAFTEKAQNAFNAGAEMVFIANNAGGPILPSTPGAPAIPIYGMSGSAGAAFIDFVADHPTDSTASVQPLEVAAIDGDALADFSYRGPIPGALQNITKPDITAPGVNIYAAVRAAEGNYEYNSGTSMASPHVAGAAALVRAAQPDWTVSEVKSAIQSTAKNPGLEEDYATPWHIDDVGHGRVDLSKAALAGLTLDETKANFLAANPSASGDPRTLNIPSLRDMNCMGSCSFTRTVKNRLATAGTWSTAFTGDVTGSVSPASFTLAPDAEQVVTITVGPKNGGGAMNFGYLTFSEDADQSPDQFFTVALKGEPPEALPDEIFADGFEGAAGPDPSAPFHETFDSYAAGSDIHGQGGWKGWGNDPSAGSIVVDSISGRTAPNALEVKGGSDTVHEFAFDSGKWTVTAQQFIPASFSGESYFIMLNQYDDAGTDPNWSVQLKFSSADGMVSNDGGNSGGSSALIRDQWVQLKVVIDLDNDTQEFWYGNTLVYSGTWSDEVSGGGSVVIAAMDLFANGASPVYYDDIKIVATP